MPGNLSHRLQYTLIPNPALPQLLLDHLEARGPQPVVLVPHMAGAARRPKAQEHADGKRNQPYGPERAMPHYPPLRPRGSIGRTKAILYVGGKRKVSDAGLS